MSLLFLQLDRTQGGGAGGGTKPEGAKGASGKGAWSRYSPPPALRAKCSTSVPTKSSRHSSHFPFPQGTLAFARWPPKKRGRKTESGRRVQKSCAHSHRTIAISFHGRGASNVKPLWRCFFSFIQRWTFHLLKRKRTRTSHTPFFLTTVFFFPFVAIQHPVDIFRVNEKPTTRCTFLVRRIFFFLFLRLFSKPWFADSTNLLANERGKYARKQSDVILFTPEKEM